MTDKKLTDSEIVKALEGAYKIEPTTMFFITDYNTNKTTTIGIGDIVDLINRQKAEIERLENKVKDFEKIRRAYQRFIYESMPNIQTALDKVLKELVGENDAKI